VPVAWGENHFGQLGTGTTQDSAVPVQVLTLGTVQGIAAGGNHSLALTSDGHVWQWGAWWGGSSAAPGRVPRLSGVQAIATGGDHSLALTSDGRVWAWMDAPPVPVPGLSGVAAIAAGSAHLLALTTAGTVWAWGHDDAGQLGLGTTCPLPSSAPCIGTTPVPVPGLHDVTAIAAGPADSLSLTADGTVWAWGDNSYGQLGTGTTLSSTVPVRVPGLSSITAISAGTRHSLALRADGTVWAWGDNASGQLGAAITCATPATCQSTVPVRVPGLNRMVAIAAGGFHNLALAADGTVWAWGDNINGQLGTGTTCSPSECPGPSPAPVRGLHGVLAIAAGDFYSLALLPVASLGSLSGGSPAGAPPLAPAPVYVHWLRVDAQHPRTLVVGGTLGCAETQTCQSWMMRSTDGGTTWADLSGPLGIAAVPPPLYQVAPVLLAPDGRHVYAPYFSSYGSPASYAVGVFVSADGGLTWQSSGAGRGGSYGGGTVAVALSPFSPGRLYGAYTDEGMGGGALTVVVSDDAGSHWHSVGSPGSLVYQLVPDPAHPNTLYANMVTAGATETAQATRVARSDDGGLTWTSVMTPTATPALRTFTVSTDPTEGPLLVGRTADAGVPADRRYLSADGGRTWSTTTCPGDLQGVCPVATLPNVFGAGASYAFVANGVYRCVAGGPAGERLSISAHLPVPTAQLLAVGGGSRAGDSVYLLGQAGAGTVHGLLYASTDGGRSWHQLAAGVLANVAPPSTAAGALYVPATHHSVAGT
jgi:alpha-tubulin suppressor-like RCC1 family protein